MAENICKKNDCQEIFLLLLWFILLIGNSNLNNEGKDMSEEKAPEGVEIFVKPHGSYHVTGTVTIVDEYGEKIVKEGKFSLCRCGASEHKPFCDGKHREIGF